MLVVDLFASSKMGEEYVVGRFSSWNTEGGVIIDTSSVDNTSPGASELTPLK